MAVNSENEFMKLRHALNMHRQQNQHQVSGKLRATKSWLDGVFTAVGWKWKHLNIIRESIRGILCTNCFFHCCVRSSAATSENEVQVCSPIMPDECMSDKNMASLAWYSIYYFPSELHCSVQLCKTKQKCLALLIRYSTYPCLHGPLRRPQRQHLYLFYLRELTFANFILARTCFHYKIAYTAILNHIPVLYPWSPECCQVQHTTIWPRISLP